MKTLTRYQQISDINDDECELVTAGHVKRNGREVVLLCQTDHERDTIYAVPNRNGEIVATDSEQFDWAALNTLCEKFGAKQLKNNYCSGTCIELPSKNASAFLKQLSKM